MRNYGKTSPATLARALAFVAITGHKNGLHMSTRIAMTSDLVDLKPYTVDYGSGPMTLHKYTLSEEGQRLAETSQLWKAHAALVAMGFRLESRRIGARRYKPGFLSYTHTEHVQGNGPQMRGAFISSGTAFAQREPGAEVPEGGKPWDYVKVDV
jgi:hypothetical protein